MRLALTTVNILGKRPLIGILTILVGSYDIFGLVRTFGWGPGDLVQFHSSIRGYENGRCNNNTQQESGSNFAGSYMSGN